MTNPPPEEPASSRPVPPHGPRRLLGAFGLLATVGAVVFVVAGVRALDSGSDGPVLYVEDVVTNSLPSTVPPLAEPAGEPAIAAEVGEDPSGSARRSSPERELTSPNRDDAVPRARPVGLQIDTVDVSRFPVRPVGLEDNGQMEVPDETEIGWYKYGATAGRPGATVLAAHVNWRGSLGPFADLGSVEPGDQIEVTLDDGTTRHYEVTERAMYGKLELPKERIWRNTGDEELVLITCGGEFNPELRSYKHNIVVYAVPVAP